MRSRRLALGIIAAPMAVLLTAPAASAARIGDFDAIAHRGYHMDRTENTIRALHGARHHGATAMETDLRLTSDRHIIVMHDSTLRRTTTCTGFVFERSRRSIKRNCRAEDGAKIPFLAELLHSARKSRMNMFLELKGDRYGRWTKHRMQVLKKVILSHHMEDRVVVISFYPHLLRRLESVAPAIRTSWIARHRPTVRQARRNADSVNVSARAVSRRLVRRMNNAGLRVYGRVTDRRTAWRKFERDGVSGTLINEVSRFKRWESR